MTYTFSRYFLEGFGTEEQLNELLHSDVLPLVRELQFKYGLKVMDKVVNVNYPEVDKHAYIATLTAWLLVRCGQQTKAGLTTIS